jgi:hypothetical protein
MGRLTHQNNGWRNHQGRRWRGWRPPCVAPTGPQRGDCQ